LVPCDADKREDANAWVLSEVMLRCPADGRVITEILGSTKPESIHDDFDMNRHIDTIGWKVKVAMALLLMGKFQLGSLPPCLRSDVEILHQP